MTIIDGKLAPCPGSPNCVSSQATDTRHHVPALAAAPDPLGTFAQLSALLERWPRVTVVRRDAHVIEATFRTRWLRFTDDATFLLNPEAGVIHVRSASRIGYSDLGCNRRRVEQLRAALESSGRAS